MANIYPPAVQRPALVKLVAALGCRDACLRRDECGDWRIVGGFGHVYAVPVSLDDRKPEGFRIYYRGAPEFEEPTSSQGWTWAKKALAFYMVVQDGDEEGALFLDCLPTRAEAEILRDKLRIPKKRDHSEEELDRLRRLGFRSTGGGVEQMQGPRSHRDSGRPEPVPAVGCGNG